MNNQCRGWERAFSPTLFPLTGLLVPNLLQTLVKQTKKIILRPPPILKILLRNVKISRFGKKEVWSKKIMWENRCLHYLFIRLPDEKPKTESIFVDDAFIIFYQLTFHFTLVVCGSCQIKRTALRFAYAEVTALCTRYDLMTPYNVTVYGFVSWVAILLEGEVFSGTDTWWLPQIVRFN